MNDFEKGLCTRINERIKLRGYCVVYDNDLTRICAPEAALRKKQVRVIERFAAKHGLVVSIREVGINATFKKPSPPEAPEPPTSQNGARPTVQLRPVNGAP
jgi:hypothetical protein